MSNTYNFHNIEATFKTYLLAENISASTLTSYLSDYRHYAGWITSYKKNIANSFELNELLNEVNFHEYKEYQQASGIPEKTINRRFSTLRKLCSLCIQQGWLSRNPAKDIHASHISVEHIMSDFELNLHNSSLSGPEQKKILADVNEFYEIINSSNV